MLGLTITAIVTATMINGITPNVNSPVIYTQPTVVVGIEDNTVITEDSTGNLWAFDEAENWVEGDLCTLVFYNNSTESIYDDVIVATRYEGHTY